MTEQSNARHLLDQAETAAADRWRGTIDVIIATWCVENAIPLLHNDRDFEAMEGRLGLVRWR